MASLVSGGWAALKWVAPRTYGPKIEALETQLDVMREAKEEQDKRIQGLIDELAPFRQWALTNLPAASSTKKYRGV